LTALAAQVDAARGSLDRLAALRALTAAASDVERATVEQARAAGASWGLVGGALGVSKQAAAKRHQPKPEPAEPDATPAVPAERRTSVKPKAAWTVTLPGGRPVLRLRKD